MHTRKFFTEASYIFLFISFHNVLSTEISVGSSILYDYLDLQIELPLLNCHIRHAGYKNVIWIKDSVVVKAGSASLASHLLSLRSLLDTNSTAFDNPFKLQGYYWCETDISNPAYEHNYLFRIENIYTFVGKLVARNGSLGNEYDLPPEVKRYLTMKSYEEEMEYTLFEALANTNVSVSDLKVFKEGGLEVHFYLYVRDIRQPRSRFDWKLDADEKHFFDIISHLENVISSTGNGDLISSNWFARQGIYFEDIELKSTIGCYEENQPNSLNMTTEMVFWPSARIGDVVIPSNACLTKNGEAVTRLCTGSFHSGAKWGMPSGNCERPPNDITRQLQDMYINSGKTGSPSNIEGLNDLTEDPSDLAVSDLHIIANILNMLSNRAALNQKDISDMLSVIDKTMETNRTELVAAKNSIRLTSRYLKIFDNILKTANDETKEIRISKRHLMIDTKFIKEMNTQDLIVGLAVTAPNIQNTLYNGSVEFLMSSHKLSKRNSIAQFSLPEDLVRNRVEEQDVPCQVNMVFFQNWDLFQTPKDVLVRRNYKVLPSPVMYVSVSGGPAWNLTDPIQLYFKDMVEEEIENPVCVYYDPRMDDGAGAWSSEGCEYHGLEHGYYHCQCHHLSIFAVILSENPYTEQKKFNLGTSVYVGCSVSILALSLSVIMFMLSKNWRKTVDHCILFCLSLTFLVCIITIFISEMHFKKKVSCILLALILHYTIFATFGWLMVLAVVYRLRFAMKTDVAEIPHFMIKAAVSVWSAPIIIVVVMWFTRDFSYSVKNGCLWTVYQVTKVSVIPVVILISVTLCIYLCATYSLTCRYRKDFLIDDTHYNDIAIKFRVTFTIFFFFVLCWLFGFLAALCKSKTLKILFSISITLTSYYVSLFFIFQEDSFWDLCKCRKRKDEHEAPVIQYNAKRYNSDAETVVKEK